VITALGGPPGWLLIFLSISVLALFFERARFWWLWWRRRSVRQRQWLELLRVGGNQALHWMDDRDLEMRFGQVFLESTAVVAPLIGLTGTVFGLSRLLAAMGPQLVLPPGRDFRSFGDVLISTAMGLLVSLIATVTFQLNQAFRQWQLTLWHRDLDRAVVDPGDP
jgi:biopolymer transport protein ExbB